MTKEIAAILAIGPKGIIGKDNKLVWKSSIDFEYFKEKTINHPCIFGATTFYGLPKYPLKNRLNIVLDNTQKENMVCDNRGWITFNSLEESYLFCENYDKIFICGGKSIYEYVLKYDLINTLYVTEITSLKLEKEAKEHLKDYKILNLNLDNKWVCSSIVYPKEQKDDLQVKFVKYIRV